MARTRLAAKKPPKKGPKTLPEWDRLMRKAIARAQKLGDQRRLRMMQTALQEGRSQQCLKRMSIICESDIDRELSDRR